MQEILNTEDPLGILRPKGSDPLGILKKKDGGEASSQMLQDSPSPSASPLIDPEEIKKRYENVNKGTSFLNSFIDKRKSVDPAFAKSASGVLQAAASLNTKGLKKDRATLLYDFFSKNSDIETNDQTRDSFIASQYSGAYFSESPDLINEYNNSDLKQVITPRQFTGLKSLSFGRQSKYADAINKLKDPSVSDTEKQILKLDLDKIGINIDKDAAASMFNENNVEAAQRIYTKAKDDEAVVDEEFRKIDYENPYTLRSFGNIVKGAVNRGLTMGNTADILTATSNESGIDVDRLARLQADMQDAKSSLAYEQFSNNPTIENFKKNPIGIMLELGLESLTALYSHGSTRMATGAATGAGLGSVVPGIGTATGASTGVIAGLGMASLNLEYSSKILEGLSSLGVNTSNPEELKNAFANQDLMTKLKEDGLKKGIPVALFDMLSAGIAGKIISKPAKSIIGKVAQGVAETAVQAGLGAAGEASGQLVSEGKISSPNAVIMEAMGEFGPGTVEIAYGNIVESTKRNNQPRKEDLVSVASVKSLDDIKFNLDAQVASGNISIEQAESIRKGLATVQSNLNKVPQDLSINAKTKLIDLVDQKSKLVDQSKTLDDAFKPEVQQQIKDIDQQILDITQNDRNAINESTVQEGRTEGDISQPQGIIQGQPEIGQGEGIQGQATQPQANVGDSNIGGQGQVAGQELSNIERLTPEQIEVSNDATGFAEQMQSAQSSLGRMGMSVTPYVQKDYDQIASEGGKFLRAAGNKVLSLLKPNGEMVSLVKDASVKAKGAAQAMISRMKDMGGLFMDNYDIYLTPIYEKAGYKVVARVPFNEEFAPEGWNAEDSPLKNKPDVVFMVRNDIAPEQEQTFTEYEEAQNYTQGLVDQAVNSGVAKLPTQIQDAGAIAKELSTELDGVGKALDEAIPNVVKSLNKSKIKIQVVDSASDTNEARRARGNQGLFISGDGTIIIDKSKLADEIEAGIVVWHEASHPVMNIIRNTNKPLYDAVVRGLNNASSKNEGVREALDWAKSQEQYDNADTQNDEAIVETIGRINAGLIDINSLDTGLRQKLIDFVNSIAKFFGIDPILNDTDIAAFKKTVSEVADALKTGRDIGEVVGQENVMEYGAPIGVPVQPKIADKYGPVVKHDGGSYKLSFVKPSDIIDIKSLVKDIADKGQKVWFWTADQLGRGMYYDNVIEGEHYLDAGPSFALDPVNREKGVIWATGKGEKWVNDKIANSDYIFIISGSPQKSKLFNKRVAEITFNRIKKAVGEEGSWDKFKSEVLGVSKIGKINEILNKYNSFEELLASPDRKELLIQFDAQKEKKGTPLKGLLEKYGAFIDYNDLRDGFFKDNDFNLNDVMLVLKPTGYGGKSAHSTYENDILGEVVGVPDRKVNAYDLMPDDFKAKYAPDMSRTEQSQAVAPYGAGVREVQASVGNRGDIQSAANSLAGDKTIKDRDGNAIVFYHGSNKKFDSLKANTTPDDEFNGVSFMDSEELASDYGTTTPYILNANLIDAREWMDLQEDAGGDLSVEEAENLLTENGYDGVDYRSIPMLGYGVRIINPSNAVKVVSIKDQASVGNRPEQSRDFRVAAFVMRKLGEGADKNEIAQGVASATGMSVADVNKIIADPEQYIRDSFPQLSKIAQDNLIERAKIQNIYRGRQFGMPINKAFVGTEVPRSRVVEYLNKTNKIDRSFKDSVKDFKNKWLDPAKGLPNWVLAIKDFASGKKNIEVARAMKTIEQLKAEAKKIGFTDWDAFSKAMVAVRDVQRYIPDESGLTLFDPYRAFEGRTFTTPDDMLPAVIPDDLKAIPESLRPFAVQMRQQIDGLTKDLIGSGYVTPEQAVTLEKNLGQYVNRAYKLYNERGFKPNPDQVVDAIKFIADQKIKQILTELFPEGKPSTSKEVSDFKGNVIDPENINMEDLYNQAVEEAKKDVQAILDKKRNPYFNTKTDSRDTGILKEKKDIPEPIRRLMGEYTDPGTVFVMTVAKQAALAAQTEYLTKLRDFGMGTIFFERYDRNRPAEFSVQIASTGTESKSPLGGLYTTPEIAEALEMADPSYNELTNAWMKIVGAVRWGKTVGSVTTQAKNFESNIGFAVLNGMFLTGENTKALKAASKYVKGQYSKAEMDQITEKAVKLNLVGQSVGARELSEMLGSGDIHDIALEIAANPNNMWGKKAKKSLNVFGAANKLYRMGDDFWKVYAYINEREMVARGRYKSSYESLNAEQQEKVDIESSERVKNTWPTYDRVVEGAKYVSKRAPIFGNFISFQAESLRVLANSIKMAREDMKDPEMRETGIKRAIGIMTYVGLRAAITSAVASAAGMAASGILGAAFGDDEEEQKKRAFKKAMPIYARTADIAVVPTDQPHKFTTFSLSSLDPYGIIPNSLNAFTEGREGIFSKEMQPGVAAAGAEFFSGFLEPEMTFSTMYSVMNNINPKTGRPIVLDSDTPSEVTKKVGSFVVGQLEPSTVSLIERGMERGWKPELASFVGARPIDIDLHKSFGYVLSDMGKQMDAIKSEYNSIKYNERSTEEEKAKAEAEAEKKKAFLISKVSETYRDFIKVGANPKVLDEMITERSSIKTTGFDKTTKRAIKTGEIKSEKLFK